MVRRRATSAGGVVPGTTPPLSERSEPRHDDPARGHELTVYWRPPQTVDPVEFPQHHKFPPDVRGPLFPLDPLAFRPPLPRLLFAPPRERPTTDCEQPDARREGQLDPPAFSLLERPKFGLRLLALGLHPVQFRPPRSLV